jgi:methyl-accepting chemotaxis protein
VEGLIALQKAAARSETSGHFGQAMTNIILFETARENAGLLRANASSLLEKDSALNGAQLKKVILLEANVSSNIASPALAISETINTQLKSMQTRESWNQVDEYFSSIILQATKGQFGIEGKKFWDAISMKINDVAEITQLSLEEISLSVPAELSTRRKFLSGALIGSIILSIGIVLLIITFSRGILIPINRSALILKDVSEGEGDLTKRLEVLGSDEIGKMSIYFNQFIGKLQFIIGAVSQNAESVAAAATELSAISTQIAAGSEELSTQISTVSSATNHATENVNSISAAAEEMSSSSHSVAAAIEQMSASLNDVARNCQKESQIAAEANQYAKKSSQVMDQLGTAAKSIGKVVVVISDIANQTNLLALNASIEAASAGDAGKGFSVVANEVKALSQKTARATMEIEKQIAEMQSNAESAILSIEAVSRIIEDVNAISQTIVSAVEEQSATVNEISRNIVGVSAGATQVSKNVSESAMGLSEVASTISGVNAGVAETAHGTQQVKTSANELSLLSEKLKELLSQFKI